ncbi:MULTISPECIES: hypothetical protein [Bacillus]|uniref:Uncharacterized protein n=2 Tax=Bacillus TaxID=1386 RepID=A0A0M3RAM8_9BACI|nr:MULTISPECIES: hypothetical protein [Bacillus]ALC83462.1 hypothetical protein AM592_19395 [Bacillus gobiensis]MBP1082416.1 hypothetical protein [Bacillus capparidis]MED1097332.1 hypothetical protein [Bacillus capparidis]
MYIQLFKLDSKTPAIWGNFFNEGEGRTFVQSITSSSMEDLKKKYLVDQPIPEAEKTFEAFIDRIKSEANNSFSAIKRKSNKFEGSRDVPMDLSLLYFLFLSGELSEEDTELFNLGTEEQIQVAGNSIFTGGHSGDNDHHSHHDSSCSSCSSCSS